MDSQFPQPLLGCVERSGVIAVLMIDEVRRAVPLARALLAGGVEIMELTLRTPAAVDGLRAIRAEVPDMIAGVGTVLKTEQVDEIIGAGAAFGVSPGLNPRVVRHALERGLPFAPGVMTPSDIEAAVELGCRELKFFPAEPNGGLPYIKSVLAPFAHLGVRFIPLGGVSPANLACYAAEKCILAVGGSWLAPKEMIQAENWAGIENNAREARAAMDRARQGVAR